MGKENGAAEGRFCEANLRYFAERVKLLMSETESRCKTFWESLPKAPTTGNS